MDNLSFGERLRIERKLIGLTQYELAQIAGIRKNAQSNYERNIRVPNLNYLNSVREVGIDVVYLFTGHRLEDRPANLKETQLPPASIDQLKKAVQSAEFALNQIKREINSIGNIHP